jgi:hypothetical protein
MKTKLKDQLFFAFSGIGEITLKGKAKSLSLYAVEPL